MLWFITSLWCSWFQRVLVRNYQSQTQVVRPRILYRSTPEPQTERHVFSQSTDLRQRIKYISKHLKAYLMAPSCWIGLKCTSQVLTSLSDLIFSAHALFSLCLRKNKLNKLLNDFVRIFNNKKILRFKKCFFMSDSLKQAGF